MRNKSIFLICLFFFLLILPLSFASLDVFIQDQTTIPVDYFFTKINGTPTTVAVNTSIDDYNVIATSTANCNTGDYVGMFNADNATQNRAFFATALNVVGTNITLDTPLDFPFNAGNTLACFSRELNVDGSVIPQIFSVEVGGSADQCIDINRIMISFVTDSAVDLNKFGDIPSLTNGLVLRRTDGFAVNIWNVKNNGEIANLCYDYAPYAASNPSQGQDGAKFRYTFNGQDKHGVAIRLCAGERLDLIIQDDLTDLQQFRVIAEGQYVDDTERDSVIIEEAEGEMGIGNSLGAIAGILAYIVFIGIMSFIVFNLDTKKSKLFYVYQIFLVGFIFVTSFIPAKIVLDIWVVDSASANTLYYSVMWFIRAVSSIIFVHILYEIFTRSEFIIKYLDRLRR